MRKRKRGTLMLHGIGVRNLRSFEQQATIALKPLTVLLGRNSSGKSSLIRLFPLLRQSVEETTTGPILWYGRYVDYGNFNEAICKRNKKENGITLSFNIELDTTPLKLRQFPKQSKRFPNLNFDIEIQIAQTNQKSYAKKISFSIDGSTIEIEPDYDNNTTLLHAFNEQIEFTESAYGTLKQDYKFFPLITWVDEDYEDDKGMPNQDNELSNYIFISRRRQIEHNHNRKICRLAAENIKHFFYHKTKKDNITEELLNIRAYSRDRLEHGLKSLFQNHIQFTKNLDTPEKKQELIDTLHPLVLLKNYNTIAELINDSLKSSFLSVKYLAPIRANTERFYRFQDLQVDEMDHTGSNIAMILNSFSEKETRAFKRWTRNNFGFIAFVTTDGSHYAIKIKTENDHEEHNISDMGYGYSQVLPIIMSIWLEINHTSETHEEIIFVIEQPELHLHPAYQTKVAQLFVKVVKAAKNKKNNIKFIFETHSQSMVEAIGECIGAKEISKEDVNITIVEKNISFGSSCFKANFDEDGYFTNWPIGFFSGE